VGAALVFLAPRPHIEAMPQHLDLTDEETAALTQELHEIVESDRYPFSPRIRTLREILAKLRPEPVRKPLPPPKGVCSAIERQIPATRGSLISGRPLSNYQ
jgi:hypothetical protein